MGRGPRRIKLQQVNMRIEREAGHLPTSLSLAPTMDSIGVEESKLATVFIILVFKISSMLLACKSANSN